jgi:hypothetical protein
MQLALILSGNAKEGRDRFPFKIESPGVRRRPCFGWFDCPWWFFSATARSLFSKRWQDPVTNYFRMCLPGNIPFAGFSKINSINSINSMYRFLKNKYSNRINRL